LDADALEHPAAAMISVSGTDPSLGRISRRNSSGSWTAPGFTLSHSDCARLRAAMAAPHRLLISGACPSSSRTIRSCSWDLVVKAVEAHSPEPWVVLYVKRWLAAPLQLPDGTLQQRDRGTHRAGYVQLHIMPPMSSVGLCAASAHRAW
jgi:hypothetical protein